MTAFRVSDIEGVLGRVDKLTAEVTRLAADFEDWLDDGETLASVSAFSIVDNGVPPLLYWQADYPLPDPVAAAAPDDTSPLVLVGSSIVGGTTVELLVGAGTPGLSYIVSCMVAGAVSGRRKELNFLVAVDPQVNDNMISSLDPTAAGTVTTVAATAVLAANTSGTVFVDNTSGAAIQITLPPSPALGQQIDGVDAGGNASVHTITWVGDSGALINGAANYAFTVDFQSASFRWSGTAWVVV